MIMASAELKKHGGR